MKMLQGLNRYQAVKFNNGFIVSFKDEQGYQPAGKHIVNGVEVTMAQVFVESLEGVKRVVDHSSVLTHYENSEGAVMSSEEVVIIRGLSFPYWEEDSDNYYYPSLEVEFDIKKRQEVIKDFKPIYAKQEDTYEDVQFVIVGCQEDTGSEFITTPYSIGKAFFDNSESVYKIESVLSIVSDEWQKLSKQYLDDKFENSTHSGFRYAKVNNTYIFNDSTKQVSDKGQYSKLFTTLLDAKKHEESIRKLIRSKVTPHLKSYQILGENDRSDICKDLQSLLTCISSIEPKQKSHSIYRQCIIKVNKLIDKLSSVD